MTMPIDPDSPSTSKSHSSPPEIEAIRAAILAAKQANLAAIRALEVVELVFAPPAREKVIPDEVSNLEPEGCQHTEAITLNTPTGAYLICPCGDQRLVG